MNPLLKRVNKKAEQRGRRSEKRVSKSLGTTPNRASGAVFWLKGDVTLPKFLIELKSTKKKSIRLEKAYFDKIALEAKNKDQIPALGISFVTELGDGTVDGDWMAIPLRVFRIIQGH